MDDSHARSHGRRSSEFPLLVREIMMPEAKLPGHATHLPLLAACVARTPGPVLELGMGAYSTPLLHAMCPDVRLLSLESDEAWFREFSYLLKGRHEGLLIHDWARAPIDDDHWSVVLVDHQPAARRVVEIERLRGKADYLVVHDTEHRLYGYEPVLTTFKQRVECQRYAPWTSVVSDCCNVNWLQGAM